MHDISFRWWFVLILCGVFGVIALSGLRYAKGFPIHVPLQMLVFGLFLTTIGILLALLIHHPITDLILLRNPTANQQISFSPWWALLCGYALMIDGVIGCIVSVVARVLEKAQKS